jgi:hypothetical protein
LNERPPDGRDAVGRSPDGRALDEPSPDERGENLGRFGFEVFENDPLGLLCSAGRPVDGRSFEDRSLDGRPLEDRGLKAGRAGLSPSRTNGLLGLWGTDSRDSSCGAEVDLGVFLPYFANALGFENFGGLSPCDRGENSGLPGLEVFPKEPPDLAGADGRAPDGPRPKLGFAPRLSALAKAAGGLPGIEGRESGRGENSGLPGLEAFPKEPPDLAGADGRAPEGPRPKLGFAPRLSALAKAAEGLPGIEDRVSGRGVNFGPAGFSPNFLND